MRVKEKIGTIQTDGEKKDVVGVCNMDGRWTVHAALEAAEWQEVTAIRSKPTFGEAKQAAAEHFAAPKYAFARHQPGVSGSILVVESPPIADAVPSGEERGGGAIIDPDKSEADHIRDHLKAHPGETNKQVIDCLAEIGVKVTSSQVSAVKRELKAD